MHSLLPYIRLYKKHWFSLSLGMLLALLTLIASMGLLSLSGWFLSAAAVAGLSVAKESFNYMLPSGGVRGFAMARTAGRWGERVVSHDATFKLLADLRVFFFNKLTPLIPGRFSKLRDADLLNRLVSDVDAMDHVYLRLISPITISFIGIIGLTLFLAYFDVQIALVLGGILLLLLIIWPILFYFLGKRNGQEQTTNKAQLRISALDWLQGHSELVLFGAEKSYYKKIEHHQSALLKNQAKNAHITGMANALLMLFNGWLLILIIWLGSDLIKTELPTPMLALFVFATMASFELLAPVAGAFQYLGQTIASANRLNEILTAKPDVIFPENETGIVDKLEQASINIKEISFSYTQAQKDVISQLSLNVPEKHKIAIVGQTGSGKSTLLQLIMRQFDPNQGEIQLANKDLKLWDEASLRANISVVSQRVDILNGSLRDNLKIASSQATETQLEDILKDVGLAHLIEQTSEQAGLDTWLGDGGRHLSGGERRRIGIARAILHDAPILLLDEPTEGLDQQTEIQIMNLLSQKAQDKTVIFITHRLVGLDKMDNIYLMDQGCFIESGSHQELLDNKGFYHKLHQKI